MAARSAEADDDYDTSGECWPENYAVWDLWEAVAEGQWRLDIVKTRIIYHDLDYSSVWSAMKMMRIKKRDRERIFSELRQMVETALAVLNEQ